MTPYVATNNTGLRRDIQTVQTPPWSDGSPTTLRHGRHRPSTHQRETEQPTTSHVQNCEKHTTATRTNAGMYVRGSTVPGTVLLHVPKPKENPHHGVQPTETIAAPSGSPAEESTHPQHTMVSTVRRVAAAEREGCSVACSPWWERP